MFTAIAQRDGTDMLAAASVAAAATFVGTRYGPNMCQKMGDALNVTLRALAHGQVDALPESKTFVDPKTQALAEEVRDFTVMIRRLECDAEHSALSQGELANKVKLVQERSDLVDTLVQAVIKKVETNTDLINKMGHQFEQFNTQLDEIEATVAEMKTDIVTMKTDIGTTKEGVKENKENIAASEQKTQQHTIDIRKLKQQQEEGENAIRELQQQQEHRDVAQNSTCRIVLNEKVVDFEQQQEDLRNEKTLQTVKVNATFGLDQVNLSKTHQQQRAAMVLQQNYEKQAMELRHRQAQVNLEANCSDEIAHLCFGKDLKLRDFADRIDNEIAALEAKKQFAIDALKSSKE